jgi:hypothetical protein
VPHVKCPSCATVVRYADGYDPICPNCGFRGPAPGRVGRPDLAGAPAGSWAQQVQPPPNEAPENGMAIGALVCGIAGFVVGITAPIAVILGIVALNQRVDGAGRGMAITGIVLGGLVTLAYLLAVLFFFAVLRAIFGG